MILTSFAWAGVLEDPTPPDGLDRAYAPRRIALIVGIDAFDDPALGNLRFAAKDAVDVAATLGDAEIGGYDVVSTVTGHVERERFWSAFRALASTVQRDDTVFVYVASHGTLRFGSSGSELMLLPTDGWLADPSTAIRVDELARAIDDLPARRTVLAIDACYSGTARSALPDDVRAQIDGFRGPIPAPPAFRVSAFSAHLFAAHVNQPAIEDPHLQNGVYTHFLIQALRGEGDVDDDGLVEVMEAHDWARDRTLEHTGGAQVPWAEVVTVGRADVFLAGDAQRRSERELAVLTGLESLPASAKVRVDGVSRGAGPLQSGERHVQVVDGDRTLVDAHRRVAPGDRMAVDRLVAGRDGRVRVLVGPSVAADRAWIGVAGIVAGLDVAPPDPGGVRWVGGLRTRVSSGPTLPEGPTFPAGTVVAAVGPAWTVGRVTAGPLLGAGWVWRRSPVSPQGALLAAPGAEGAVDLGPWTLAIDLRMPTFAADGGWVVSPEASVLSGLRW